MSATAMPRCACDALAVPAVHQVLAAGALDVDVGVGVGDVEAGGEHHDVDRMLDAVGGDDAVGVIRVMRSVITWVFGLAMPR